MRRYFFVASLVLFLLCGSILWSSIAPSLAQSRVQPEGQVNSNTSPTNASQPTETVTPPNLQCQGCHGPGKTLPYLGGAQFHTEPHAAYSRGYHAQKTDNNGNAATCIDCHTTNGDLSTMLAANDPKSTINRANIAATCGRCHGDKSVMQGSGISNRLFLSYKESVHAQAVARGNTRAAVCTDCHNSHDIRAAVDAASTIARVNIPRTCGTCHQKEQAEFVESVHGEAVARGVSRSPTCTDCHGIHSIQKPIDETTAAVTQAVGTDSCAKCHEGVALTKEFGVAGGRVASYRDSYHGLASKLGLKIAANCSSCHGVHNILPSTDSRSMIHAANLTQTCGQCHVGATANFATGRIHLSAPTTSETSSDLAQTGTTWVRRIYLPLIILTIGGMVLHNVLVWRKKAIAKRKMEHRAIVRLTRSQRIQHWLLLTSFIALVLSGFALQYPESWLAWSLGADEALRRVIHRVAAVVMLVVGGYHLLYLAFTAEGRRWVMDMMPSAKDVKDLIQNFAYYLGLKPSKAKIDRFGYAEKAEYWAVVWGTLIMGLTGLMIWFKLGIFAFLPRWAIEVAIAIHFYEAVLATLAIIVWHFYHVIFDPDVYPINWAFYDGRVSEELYKEEHELAYERLARESEDAEGAEPEGGSDTVPATGGD
ncbi:MAG TPA: cytochrome c3 family protein [Pyrinomonadaceae bacterium]|nr:cytochrome c3 family protein [Pyrinomonadaceae bacterium]